MARFRFKIVDSQGRRRSGILRADSLDIAESTLRSKLCQIDELTPLSDEGQALPVDDLSRAFSRADAVRRVLTIALSCLCLFFLIGWMRTPRAYNSDFEPSPLTQFVIQGRLDLGSSSSRYDLDELRIYAVFPELTYEVEAHPQEDGRFAVEFSLLAPRPKGMSLQIGLEGKRWTAIPEIRLPATGDIDLKWVTIPSPQSEPNIKFTPTAVVGHSTYGKVTAEKADKKKRRRSIRKLLEERRRPR